MHFENCVNYNEPFSLEHHLQDSLSYVCMDVWVYVYISINLILIM